MNLTTTYELANGLKIPILGFGTWQTPDGEIAEKSVLSALENGYRHLDTAAVYGNEQSVGQALKKASIKREDIFLTTKLWNNATTYEDAKREIKASLDRLAVDYFDLYLIHWPNPAASQPNNGKRNADIWRAMEEAYNEGKIKAIGVSNFRKAHLDTLLETAKIMPMVNQIYVNPFDQQLDVVSYNDEHGILTEAYSPLGTGEIFKISSLQKIADKLHKSIAQIVLRWSLQKGYLPLPKSVHQERIKENTEIFDFNLSTQDLATIDRLQGQGRMAQDPDQVDF